MVKMLSMFHSWILQQVQNTVLHNDWNPKGICSYIILLAYVISLSVTLSLLPCYVTCSVKAIVDRYKMVHACGSTSWTPLIEINAQVNI
jgi:hypothetical protein